jgi:hypothetical protein
VLAILGEGAATSAGGERGRERETSVLKRVERWRLLGVEKVFRRRLGPRRLRRRPIQRRLQRRPGRRRLAMKARAKEAGDDGPAGVG